MTKKMGPIEKTLRAGLRRISDKAHWTQDTFARNKSGAEVVNNSRSAVSFCAVGCLKGGYVDISSSLLDNAAMLVAGNRSNLGVVTINDNPGGTKTFYAATILP